MRSTAQASPSLLHRVFFSPEEPRLRAGWRLVLQFALILVLVGIFSIPIGLLPAQSSIAQTLAELASVAGITLSIWIARRVFDRRTFTSLGLRFDRKTLPDLLFGFAAMGVVMGAIYLAEWGLGWLRFEGFAWKAQPQQPALAQAIVGAFWLFILVGWQEELLTRGYILQNMADGLNLVWGVILSSSVFAVLHALNPHASLMAVSLLVVGGLFLALGYLRTRQLWLPIGLHIGWNFFEGPVFGFPVSGLTLPNLIQQVETGPDLWTGGAFGPEAGLIVIPALAFGAALVIAYTHNRLVEQTGD